MTNENNPTIEQATATEAEAATSESTVATVEPEPIFNPHGRADFKKSFNLDDVLFGVKEAPVFVNGVPVQGYKALINENDGTVISCVSTRYSPLDNRRALEYMTDLLKGANINYQLGRGLMSPRYTKTAIEIILPDHQIILKNGDRMELRGYLINSFNGSKVIELQVGNFRHACMNLAIPVGKADEIYKIKHLGDVNGKVYDAFRAYLADKIDMQGNFFNALQEVTFGTKEKALAYIVNEKNNLVSKRNQEKVVETWRRGYGEDPNAFAVYNAYTDFLTHGLNTNGISRMDSLRKLSLAANHWLNGELEAVPVIETEPELVTA